MIIREMPRVAMSCAIATALATPASGQTERIETPVMRISPEGIQEQVGTVVAVQQVGSLELTLRLEEFPPGWHAMHVHENPDCRPALEDGLSVAGGAAGGHFDPTGAMTAMDHGTRPSDGKARAMDMDAMPTRSPRPLGDLPAVFTDARGVTDARILSYQLVLAQIRGRSLVLHAHQEASDDPRVPSGGGAKIACAVFPR